MILKTKTLGQSFNQPDGFSMISKEPLKEYKPVLLSGINKFGRQCSSNTVTNYRVSFDKHEFRIQILQTLNFPIEIFTSQ